MTPSETVLLTRYVKACCPQQQIDDYTPDAWHDLLGDLPAADCREAVIAVAKRQPFVSPAEIRAEIKRIRRDRLDREIMPAPSSELTEDPGRYKAALQAGIRRTADGLSMPYLVLAPVREDAPPEAFAEARAKLGPTLPRSKRELARRQAEQSRAERAAREVPGAPAESTEESA